MVCVSIVPAHQPIRAYRLSGEERVAEGSRRVARGRAEEAIERLDLIAAGEADVAVGVHGARKDLKKLRTLLRLLREGLPKQLRREEAARYRAAAGALAGARDAEVKVETLTLLRGEQGPPATEAAEAWRRILERDRDAARASLDASALTGARELLAAGREGIDRWPLAGGSWELLGGGVGRAFAGGRRAMSAAAGGGGDDDFHAWRKRAKDLWYALRLLEAAWPEVLGPTAEEAHRLTEQLGEHHDLAVLRADLAQRRLGEAGTAALEEEIEARQRRLAAAAAGLGERLYGEPPKAFVRRLHGYWKAWRVEDGLVEKADRAG